MGSAQSSWKQPDAAALQEPIGEARYACSISISEGYRTLPGCLSQGVRILEHPSFPELGAKLALMAPRIVGGKEGARAAPRPVPCLLRAR